jgi:hypothetical protein
VTDLHAPRVSLQLQQTSYSTSSAAGIRLLGSCLQQQVLGAQLPQLAAVPQVGLIQTCSSCYDVMYQQQMAWIDVGSEQQNMLRALLLSKCFPSCPSVASSCSGMSLQCLQPIARAAALCHASSTTTTPSILNQWLAAAAVPYTAASNTESVRVCEPSVYSSSCVCMPCSSCSTFAGTTAVAYNSRMSFCAANSLKGLRGKDQQ